MQNRALPGRARGGAARPYDFTGQNFAPQPLAHPLAHPLWCATWFAWLVPRRPAGWPTREPGERRYWSRFRRALHSRRGAPLAEQGPEPACRRPSSPGRRPFRVTGHCGFRGWTASGRRGLRDWHRTPDAAAGQPHGVRPVRPVDRCSEIHSSTTCGTILSMRPARCSAKRSTDMPAAP